MLTRPANFVPTLPALCLCGASFFGCSESPESDPVPAEPIAVQAPAVNPPLMGQTPLPAASTEQPPAMPITAPAGSASDAAADGDAPTPMPSMTGVEGTPPAPMGTTPVTMSSAPTSTSAVPATGTASAADGGAATMVDAGAAMPSPEPEPEPFNPCPTNGDPCRVMPMGDSITSGARSSHSAGYRPALFQLTLADNKAFTFVGSAQNGPMRFAGETFPRDHEGHSGWTIDNGGGRNGLFPRVASWLSDHPPHIILLMIGTNDVDLDLDLGNARRRLELLVDRIIENAPDALLVLAQIVPTNSDGQNQTVSTFNAPIPEIVAGRAEAGKHIIMVDMYDAFISDQNYKATILADKLHPNDQGYVRMAEVWYEAIADLLPE